MMSFWIGMAAGVAVLALLCWCAALGFRNGDRPDDATVSAVRARVPSWAGGGLAVTVPRLTKRRKFRPGAYATVGIVPGDTAVAFMVPVDAPARRYRLTAVVGQPDGRLRVCRLRVPRAHVPAARSHRSVRENLSH